MPISFRSKLSSTVANNTFLDKTIDDLKKGKLGLYKVDVSEGSAITDVQQYISEIVDTVGITGEGDATSKIYSSQNYVVEGDSRKIAIGRLDAQTKVNSDAIVDHETRISQNTLDIDALQNDSINFIRKDGSVEMEADLSFFDGVNHHRVTGLADPINPRDAVNKQTLDTVSAGIIPRPAVKAATTSGFTATYDNGVADDGVGATLNIGPFLTLDIDGVTDWVLFDGILIKNQTPSLENGRYYVSQVGDDVTDWILTRCGTCDESDEMPASYMFAQFGTENAGKGFVAIVGVSAGPNSDSFDIGYDSITFTQFTGTEPYSIGDGLQLIGNEISAKVDDTSITIDGAGSLSAVVPPSVSVSALDIDWSLGNLFYKDVATNETFTFSNLIDGKTISVAIRNTSGSDVTLTLPTVVKSSDFSNVVKASNKETVFTFMYLNSKVYASSLGDMS